MNMPKQFVKKKSQTSIRDSSSAVLDQKNCFNMEDLMQFEAARQRALSQLPPDDNDQPFSDFVPHRVFVNHVDTFNGFHLINYLSNQRRDLEREGEGEAEESKHEDNPFPDDENQLENGDEDDDLEPDSDENEYQEHKFSSFYEIIGTLQFIDNPKYSRPEGISELLDQEKKSEFLEKLLTCGFIVYDITSDLSCHPKQIEEAKWVIESIVTRLEEMERHRPNMFAKYKECRVFILISTLMTWAKTKPIDPNDPSLPFTERDFRKRKPHPNYKVHCELEKRVIELGKKYPEHLKTIVVGTGVPYGYEEDILHFFFKLAWTGAPHLPIFRPGSNTIPVIHIDSLSSIVHVIIESFPQKYKYIIATDPHSVTLREIAKLLAKELGTGKTILVSKEEAFLYPDIKQRNYDMLTGNLNIVPGYIMDNVIKWGSELPFSENISKLIEEFRTARGLLPVKIFIHGPPASGKTFLAERLSLFYDIPRLDAKKVVDETIQTLKEKIRAKKEKTERTEEAEKVDIEGDEVSEEEEEDDDDGEDLETLQELLREIENNMNEETHKLDDEYTLRLFKEKLLSNLCQNKGYVIDGYPETMELTKALYEPNGEAVDEEEGDEGQGDVSALCNMKIMPAYVESLDASDEFLINRVIKMPEVNMTQFEEEDMCRRLTEFRALNTEDNTPLIFYDELDVHPMIYNIENDSDPQMNPTFQAIIYRIGPPRNYAKEETLEEVLESEKRSSKYKNMEELKAQREEVRRVAQNRRDNMEKWMFLKNQELEMEEKALLVMGMPLRHYLMKYIFPTLTRGLVEVARLRPEDPVDFLSEFLFRENPEGKMFQPNYEEREEKLAQAIKEYENSLLGKQTSEGRSTKSFSTEKSVRSGIVSGVTNYKCSSTTSAKSKSRSSRTSGKSTGSTKASSGGVCTCKKSPSLSTCSSDRTPSTPVSCTCSVPEPCEPCEPCDTPPEEKEETDPCKCPC